MEGRSDQNQISAVSQGESNLTEWRQVLMLLVLTKIHQLSEKSFYIYIYELYDNGNCELAQDRPYTFTWKW